MILQYTAQHMMLFLVADICKNLLMQLVDGPGKMASGFIRYSRRRQQETIPILFLNDIPLPYEEEIMLSGMTFDKKLT